MSRRWPFGLVDGLCCAEGGRTSGRPEPRELDPVAAGLIWANLTHDKFAADRILTRVFEADLGGLFFAFTVANLAGRILAQACGSEAQAAVLVDSWITGLVRDRTRSVALQLDIGLVWDFGLLLGLGLGPGFPLDPGSVFAAGLLFGFQRGGTLCSLVQPRQ